MIQPNNIAISFIGHIIMRYIVHFVKKCISIDIGMENGMGRKLHLFKYVHYHGKHFVVHKDKNQKQSIKHKLQMSTGTHSW